MARVKFWTWQQGQTYGVLQAPAGSFIGSPSKPYILVTDDSENWVAKKIGQGDPWVQIINGLKAQGVKVRARAGARATLEPEWRLPLEWAAREINKRKREVEFTIQTEAQKRAKTTVKKLQNGEAVSYIGWELVEKQSAHTIDALHKTIEKAIVLCEKEWGWKPVDLRVKFHTTGNAFGLAYSPGRKDHIISLLKRMLMKYDIDSAYRVILHEFCHHYRDERFRQTANDHDSIFCRELAKVDPSVEGDLRQCVHFVDVADPALAAKHQRQKNEPVWSAEAGTVVLWHKKSDNSFSLYWKPNKGYKWSTWRVSLNADNLIILLKQFAPSEWGKVRVELHPKSAQSFWRRINPENYEAMPLTNLAVLTGKTFKRVGDAVLPYMKEALS